MKSDYIRVRLDEKEKAAVKRQAKRRGKERGFDGVSAYIRWLIAWDGHLDKLKNRPGPG